MANELRHEDTATGTTLQRTDWEDVDNHRFDSQATGDLLYASSVTQLRRLGIGAGDTILSSQGGVPVWRTPANILTDLSGQAGAAFDWGGQNLTNLGSIAAFTLAGKLTAGATEIEGTGFDINGGTMAGITLDGALTLGGQAFDAGAGTGLVTTTGNIAYTVRSTANSAAGVRLYLETTRTGADSDTVGDIRWVGKDDAAAAETWGILKCVITDATAASTTSKFQWLLMTNNALNDPSMELSGAGALWVDYDIDFSTSVDSALVADHVSLGCFDEGGKRKLAISQEEPVVTEAIGASDRTLPVRINGTTYKILLKA